MNYGKVDAALAAALDAVTDAGARSLPVSVELVDDAGEVAETVLLGLGLGIGGRARAATLSARHVDELSELPWVRRLRLSRPLGLADGP